MERTFTVEPELYASSGQRFLNLIVDTVVYYLITFAVLFLLGVVAAILQMNGLMQWLGNMGDADVYLIFIPVYLAYFVVMETFTSRTVAKFLTKTIVVMEDGSKPSSRTIWKRTFCRLIPFEPLSCLSSRGWHDTIPDVYVVKRTEFEKARELFFAFEEIGETNEKI